MLVRWEFEYGNESGEWRWLHTHPASQRIRCSRASFTTLRDCEKDAVHHGYVGAASNSSHTERRLIRRP